MKSFKIVLQNIEYKFIQLDNVFSIYKRVIILSDNLHHTDWELCDTGTFLSHLFSNDNTKSLDDEDFVCLLDSPLHDFIVRHRLGDIVIVPISEFSRFKRKKEKVFHKIVKEYGLIPVQVQDFAQNEYNFGAWHISFDFFLEMLSMNPNLPNQYWVEVPFSNDSTKIEVIEISYNKPLYKIKSEINISDEIKNFFYRS